MSIWFTMTVLSLLCFVIVWVTCLLKRWSWCRCWCVCVCVFLLLTLLVWYYLFHFLVCSDTLMLAFSPLASLWLSLKIWYYHMSFFFSIYGDWKQQARDAVSGAELGIRPGDLIWIGRRKGESLPSSYLLRWQEWFVWSQEVELGNGVRQRLEEEG